MTNNSSKTPAMYLDTLRKTGINTDGIEIISSLGIALHYFKQKKVTKLCYIANEKVGKYIEDKGFIYDDTEPQALLLTYDTEINYEKLLLITKLINKSVPYYATHSDYVCPTGMGYAVPDIGCFIELIKITTGQAPVKTFGKPNTHGVIYVSEKEGIKPSDIVVAGDRLYTDIQAAINSGAVSVLVLTGETSRDMYESSEEKADIVIEQISELISFV